MDGVLRQEKLRHQGPRVVLANDSFREKTLSQHQVDRVPALSVLEKLFLLM